MTNIPVLAMANILLEIEEEYVYRGCWDLRRRRWLSALYTLVISQVPKVNALAEVLAR